jgi:hypothetical protein
MPKKFGTNTKKEEARERKKQKKKEEKEKAEREAEDEYWREKDPKILEKQAEKKRKEKEKEEKQKEKQRLKEELKKEEEETLAKKKKNQVSAPTRKQIQEYEEERIKKLLKEKEEEDKEKNKNEYEDLNMDEEFVNENYKKLKNKTEGGVDIIEASGVESALQEISLEEYDKHPEKRMRQAWNAFFEKQLPIYKEKYPNLKRQQYINMIQKEFQTSPDNPVYMKKIKDAKIAEEKDEDEK